MCGIAGIYSHKPVAPELYESIVNLQHRGTDAAGIMTYDDRMHKEKGLGLARDIFTEDNLSSLLEICGFEMIQVHKFEPDQSLKQ
mgnify:CR=1 FL=1